MKHQNVQEYYGKVLQSSVDLQTNACCEPAEMAPWLKKVLAQVHDEILMRYYGCGLIAPEALKGLRVLDLGCGAGRDVYALSRMVGEHGFVVGVDMTVEQLDVARNYQEYHRDAYGYAKSNVEFYEGYIESLEDLPLDLASFDVIVSNCVVNLAMDKDAVLRGAFNLLKSGGEMYFSDVYADRRVPLAMVKDEVLYGECLSGALYWNDFLCKAKAVGFIDPRLVSHRPITIENSLLEAAVAPLKFTSATYRLWKLDGLEFDCEDYGQAVIYRGTIENCQHSLPLDGHHLIRTGKVFPVCGNTWHMLAQTRFAPHFEFIGNFDCHYGIFEGCGAASPFEVSVLDESCC